MYKSRSNCLSETFAVGHVLQSCLKQIISPSGRMCGVFGENLQVLEVLSQFFLPHQFLTKTCTLTRSGSVIFLKNDPNIIITQICTADLNERNKARFVSSSICTKLLDLVLDALEAGWKCQSSRSLRWNLGDKGQALKNIFKNVFLNLLNWQGAEYGIFSLGAIIVSMIFMVAAAHPTPVRSSI